MHRPWHACAAWVWLALVLGVALLALGRGHNREGMTLGTGTTAYGAMRWRITSREVEALSIGEIERNLRGNRREIERRILETRVLIRGDKYATRISPC